MNSNFEQLSAERGGRLRLQLAIDNDGQQTRRRAVTSFAASGATRSTSPASRRGDARLPRS
jgi:hypothetical protein